MEAIIENFIKYIRYELNLSAHTVSAYNTDLQQLCDWWRHESGTEPDITTLTAADIRAWLTGLHARGISQRSIRRKMQALRKLYLWAHKQHMVQHDPSRMIDLAKFEQRLPKWVRPETLDTIIDTPQESDPTCSKDLSTIRDSLIIRLLYETGIRRAELIGLKDKDVDTTRGEIKVLGKRNKERIIPIGSGLSTAIEHYRTLRNSATGQSSTFFTLNSGEPLYPTYVYRIVRDMLADAGMPAASPHTLRHSFASAMLNNGAEINSVKELLGHTSLSATQIYTHITLSELKANYQQAHPRADKRRRKL